MQSTFKIKKRYTKHNQKFGKNKFIYEMMRNTNMANKQQILACTMFFRFKTQNERNYNTKEKEKS